MEDENLQIALWHGAEHLQSLYKMNQAYGVPLVCFIYATYFTWILPIFVVVSMCTSSVTESELLGSCVV